MRDEIQVNAKLREIKHMLRMPRNELLEEFSIPFSAASYREALPLAGYAEPCGQSMTSSLIQMQVLGRAEGWIDCLHWVRGDPKYVRQHTKRHYRQRKR